MVGLWLVLAPTVALVAGLPGLVLGALMGAALSPLVVRARARPGPLAVAVAVVLTGGGALLLCDLDLPGTLTDLERRTLLAVLPSALGGAAAAWQVLRAARVARGATELVAPAGRAAVLGGSDVACGAVPAALSQDDRPGS